MEDEGWETRDRTGLGRVGLGSGDGDGAGDGAGDGNADGDDRWDG